MQFRQFMQFRQRFAKKILGKPNIFFLHIPKTGGSSVDRALKLAYWIDYARINSIYAYDAAKTTYPEDSNISTEDYVHYLHQSMTAYEMAKEVSYISAHAPFCSHLWEKYRDRYQYVTLLRNPVKRYLSHYFFNVYKKNDDSYRINEDLATFIETPRGKGLGHLYVKYLGGVASQENYRSQEAVTRAKENLACFSAVGILENLEKFKATVKQNLGIALRIPHTNKNPASVTETDPQILEKIAQICEPDIAVYEYLKNQCGTVK